MADAIPRPGRGVTRFTSHQGIHRTKGPTALSGNTGHMCHGR